MLAQILVPLLNTSDSVLVTCVFCTLNYAFSTTQSFTCHICVPTHIRVQLDTPRRVHGPFGIWLLPTWPAHILLPLARVCSHVTPNMSHMLLLWLTVFTQQFLQSPINRKSLLLPQTQAEPQPCLPMYLPQMDLQSGA